jgi:hypothetical protein
MGGGDGVGRSVKGEVAFSVTVSGWIATMLASACAMMVPLMATQAHAEPVYQASADPNADALDMLAALEDAERVGLFARGGTGIMSGAFLPDCPGAIDLSASGWKCVGSSALEGRWNASPVVSLEQRRQNAVFVCLRYSPDQQCNYADGNRFAANVWSLIRDADGNLIAGRARSVPPQAYRALDAIHYFAQRRVTRHADQDSEFIATLRSASTPMQQSEDLRRVQVQVEVAIRANRTVDAARLYRDALRTAPAWPEGHFNLGLLYGELELYPEAITEMRRYLYLAPNAPDVRAVQDRIYEWEAAMGPGAR